MVEGIIYIATSPSNKKYVGQTIDTIDNRWRDHVYDAQDPNKNHCVALNNAIRKYGPNEFKLKTLLRGNADKNIKYDGKMLSQLDLYEDKFIELYQTTNPKFGYNIKKGGSAGLHAETTKKKISDSLKGRIVKESTKLKLSLTTKSDKKLPMYIIEYKPKGKHLGYRVCNHPMGPERKFSDSKLPMENKLSKAKGYLEYLNGLDQPILVKKHDLPKYFQRYRKGYCIKYPGYKTRYFLSENISEEERYNNANIYYQECVTMSAVQRADGNGSDEA